MKLARHLAMLTALLLVCTCTYTVTAQGGCNALSSSNGLVNGQDKTGNIPNVRAFIEGTVFYFVINYKYLLFA